MQVSSVLQICHTGNVVSRKIPSRIATLCSPRTTVQPPSSEKCSRAPMASMSSLKSQVTISNSTSDERWRRSSPLANISMRLVLLEGRYWISEKSHLEMSIVNIVPNAYHQHRPNEFLSGPVVSLAKRTERLLLS